MFQYRVVEYFSDRGFGVALCTDDFHARKIFVRDNAVISGGLKTGALIECEIELLPRDTRYSGKDIRVLEKKKGLTNVSETFSA